MFPVVVTVEPRLAFDLARLWERARSQAGLKQEALASFMGISPAQLADQLAGRGHLSLQRLLMIAEDEDGRRFLRYLAVELAEASGMDLEALYLVSRIERVAAKLIDRVQRKAPVKADLRVRAKKEIA